MKRRLLVLAVLVFSASLALSLAGTSTSATGGHVKNFKHVFVFMMENTGIEALQKNPNAPWINQAIQTYGVAGNYYGVTHPSQPNYIASTAGTTAGVPDDNDVTVNLPNIVDQLEARTTPGRGTCRAFRCARRSSIMRAGTSSTSASTIRSCRSRTSSRARAAWPTSST